MRQHFSLTTALALLLVGCASKPSESEMNYLASALTKVSAAVDATVRYRRTSDEMTESQLLQASTAHDPALLRPFENLTVRILRDGRDSAVLICHPANSSPLLEDAGCTAKMDVHRWSQSTDELCVFTINVKNVCAR